MANGQELQADEDDFQPPPMDPSERILLENVLKVSALFEDIVKQARGDVELGFSATDALCLGRFHVF